MEKGFAKDEHVSFFVEDRAKLDLHKRGYTLKAQVYIETISTGNSLFRFAYSSLLSSPLLLSSRNLTVFLFSSPLSPRSFFFVFVLQKLPLLYLI